MVEAVLSPAVTNQLDRAVVRGRDRPSRPVATRRPKRFFNATGKSSIEGDSWHHFMCPAKFGTIRQVEK